MLHMNIFGAYENNIYWEMKEKTFTRKCWKIRQENIIYDMPTFG